MKSGSFLMGVMVFREIALFLSPKSKLLIYSLFALALPFSFTVLVRVSLGGLYIGTACHSGYAFFFFFFFSFFLFFFLSFFLSFVCLDAWPKFQCCPLDTAPFLWLTLSLRISYLFSKLFSLQG